MQATPLLGDRRTRPARRTRVHFSIAALSLVVSLIVGVTVEPATLWGFLPIGLYGVLAAIGMPILRATLVSVLSALLILLPAPPAMVEMARESATDQVTLIGVVILLGGALAEVLRATGAATTIVSTTMRLVGTSNTTSVALGLTLLLARFV